MKPDDVLIAIADYVVDAAFEEEAYRTARLCLMDSLGCALLSLRYPECTQRLGPIVPGATLPGGARVPGTSWELDPVQAAFNIGSMIRWLDYNDTWLAAEWGHPSDNFGGILAAADWACRQDNVRHPSRWTVHDVLTAAIKAYEIQGVLALENAFNRVGLDHVLLVRIATTAVVTELLGGDQTQIINAVSNAWIDGGCLRTYRHAPNTGPRKSWAAGDATSRGVRLALMALAGEMGSPTVLSTPQWGFQDVLLEGRPVQLAQPLTSYVMENILFKIAFPAEFHAQTAVEAAIQLHPDVRERLEQITRILIETQESAIRIIDKTGPLTNPADRDHCLQYVVAIGLLHGRLTSDDYQEEAAQDPRIDRLRQVMDVRENLRYSQDYLDAEKRSIANSVQVMFSDGSATDRVEIEYPIGHRRRRAEGIPLLERKFETNLSNHFSKAQRDAILELFHTPDRLDTTPINEFMDLFCGEIS